MLAGLCLGPFVAAQAGLFQSKYVLPVVQVQPRVTAVQAFGVSSRQVNADGALTAQKAGRDLLRGGSFLPANGWSGQQQQAKCNLIQPQSGRRSGGA